LDKGGSLSFYLIVRGPLGAGKTTLARLLADALDGRSVAIDPILERWVWDGGSESLFLRANRVASDQAFPLLKDGVRVVVDGNFYWKSALEDLQRRLRFPHAVFTLKVPIEVCLERDQGRELSYGEESTREVFEKTTSFEYGIPVDATGPVSRLVPAILLHLRSLGLDTNAPEEDH
jgi:thymidylate kinase